MHHFEYSIALFSISPESRLSAAALFLTVQRTLCLDRPVLLAMSACFSSCSTALITLNLSDSEISYPAAHAAGRTKKKKPLAWLGCANDPAASNVARHNSFLAKINEKAHRAPAPRKSAINVQSKQFSPKI